MGIINHSLLPCYLTYHDLRRSYAVDSTDHSISSQSQVIFPNDPEIYSYRSALTGFLIAARIDFAPTSIPVRINVMTTGTTKIHHGSATL